MTVILIINLLLIFCLANALMGGVLHDPIQNVIEPVFASNKLKNKLLFPEQEDDDFNDEPVNQNKNLLVGDNQSPLELKILSKQD